MIQRDISTYGLVGFPVKHSLSPLMHNTAFKLLGAEANYELFSLEESELDGFFSELKEESSPIFGLNVTIPYKEKVIKYLDGISPFAEKVGAVNTIVIMEDRRLIGYNTDGPGFIAHLEELKFSFNKKRVAIMGAGGAARALVTALCIAPNRPQSLKICDIDKGKTDNLINDLGERINVGIVEAVNSIDDLNIELADLLLNATPIGMKETDPVLIEEDLLHQDMLVYDLIYNPSETTLLKIAKDRGANTSNGLGMLFYQGVLAFQHWAEGEIPDKVKKAMRQALEKGLAQK